MIDSMEFELSTNHLYTTVTGTDSTICGALKEGEYYSLNIIWVIVNH